MEKRYKRIKTGFSGSAMQKNQLFMIVIVFGLPGSGKSYFASGLSTLINAAYINSDQVRKQMAGKKTYSKNEKLSVYYEMLLQMKELMKQKRTLVLDATFYKNDIRKKFMDEAGLNGGIKFIEVTADESLIRERLKTPRLDSDADFKVYKLIKEQWEPLYEPHLILLSTNNNIADMLLKAADYLHVKR